MQLFNNIQAEIIKRIKNSDFSLKIAVTWFTNHDIFEAILEKLNIENYSVEIIVLNDRINNKREGLKFQRLIDLGGTFLYSDIDNMVHHKFCIVDEEWVITGSYNWTYYAENRNWENVVILNEEAIVNDYIEEFKKITSRHHKIINIFSSQKDSISINSNDYLITDYRYQASREISKGNELNAAKIYNELLKFNPKQQELITNRNEILKKYNSNNFDIAPYEIGLNFQNGYRMVIPAYTELPYEMRIIGKTISDNQTSVQITVQKFDKIPKTILQFALEHIQPYPASTAKIEHLISLDNVGILKITCHEIDGYGRSITRQIELM